MANRFQFELSRIEKNMENTNEEKKVYTEAERLELAAKLDADLDVFIDSLEKKRYTEGWDPETFEKVRNKIAK